MTDKFARDLELKAKYDEGNGLFYVIDVDGDVNDNFDSLEDAERYVARYYERYWKAKAKGLSPEALADSLAQTWAIKATKRNEADIEAQKAAYDIWRSLVCGYDIDEETAIQMATAAGIRTGVGDIGFDLVDSPSPRFEAVR